MTAAVSDAYSGLSLDANILAAIVLVGLCALIVSLASQSFFQKWLDLFGRLRGVIRSFIIGVPVTLALVYSYRALSYLFTEAADYGVTWLDVAKVVGALGGVTLVGYLADKVGSRIKANVKGRDSTDES